jgi:CPA1 family monovalent cation:H+ antiporter
MDLILPEIDFIVLLSLATIVAILVKRVIRLPYTIALVVSGMIIGLFHITHISLTKDLIFFFFLPPLLFEGALHFEFNHLKENARIIGSLAVIGMGVTTAIVGTICHLLLGIPWLHALLFGAIISPTDPISVIALFRKLGVEKRLSIIVEGESIFNDGMGIVVFGILFGMISKGAFDPILTIKDFVVVTFGGVAVGAILGFFAYVLLKRVDDHVVEVLITILLAYGSFIVAEHTLHLSGVMAVVAAGVLIGNQGKQLAMSPTTRISIHSFWEILAFIVNSLIFILIGLKIPIVEIIGHGSIVIVGIVAVVIGRAVAVYGLFTVLNLLWERVKTSWVHVVYWGGIRGSIPIALILGLPTIGYREEIAVMVYGVVLFSLIFQGLSMGGLLRLIGMRQVDEKEREYGFFSARRVALNRLLEEVQRLEQEGRISKKKAAPFEAEYTKELEDIKRKLDAIDDEDTIYEKRLRDVKKRLLLVEKDVYIDLVNEGSLDEQNAERLISKIDDEIDKF